jgi:hypothetical protein
MCHWLLGNRRQRPLGLSLTNSKVSRERSATTTGDDHWQPTSVLGLDLALLIYAQDQGGADRAEVETAWPITWSSAQLTHLASNSIEPETWADDGHTQSWPDDDSRIIVTHPPGASEADEIYLHP